MFPDKISAVKAIKKRHLREVPFELFVLGYLFCCPLNYVD